jgi:hypothetical protein
VPSYILRSIDPDLWARVKQRASADQLPLRVLILQLLKGYAEGRIRVTADWKE